MHPFLEIFSRLTSIPAFHFTAGLLSGLTTSVLLQPADLLKTRIQQSSRSPTSHNASPLAAALRSISNSPNPLRALWRGTVPSTIRTSFGSALYFGGLDQLRRLVQRTTPSATTLHPTTGERQLTHTANLLTGAFARAAAGFGVMPVTVLKVRYESSLFAYKTLRQAVADVYRAHGVRGFFAGFGATAVRDAPYAGLYVLFYEACKRRLGVLPTSAGISSSTTTDAVLSHGGGSSEMSHGATAALTFLSGVVAAGAATALTNPFDAIKTRLQLEPIVYGNMVRAARKMLREEGWRCMFDGLALRMARKGMSSALAWTVYEELVRRAEDRWVRQGDTDKVRA